MKIKKNMEINDKKFLRLTAIERITFNKMLEILKTEELKSEDKLLTAKLFPNNLMN